MPPEMLQALKGCDPDVQKNRAEARQIMQKLGYGPDSRLKNQRVGPRPRTCGTPQ